MYRTQRRRPSAARILGLALVAVAYAVTLVWAADVAAPLDPAPVANTAGIVTAGASSASDQAAEMEAAPANSYADQSREAPLVTLGLAAGALVAGAGWYRLTTGRRRNPIGRRARLAVRQLTALL